MAENDAAESERRLGRTLAAAIPILTVLAAIGVGFTVGLGPAVLVVGGGGLLGTIAFFWASLRTLAGDAPLPSDMESVAVRRSPASELEERKRRVLRALKDIENERRFGKIDEADYQDVSAKYREEAKEIMRQQDLALEPFRAKAEKIAQEHLAKKGLGEGKKKPEPASEPAVADEDAEPREKPRPSRVECPKCETSNEPDAAFCKKCGTKLAEDESA
jgi:hypothetical protein